MPTLLNVTLGRLVSLGAAVVMLSGSSAQRVGVEWRIEQLAGVRVGEVKSVLALLKQGVANDDRTAVCALATYPLQLLEREVPNAGRCVGEYRNIFDAEVVSTISSQRFEDLVVSWQGVRIARGEGVRTFPPTDVWLAGVCRSPDCRQYDLRITRVGSPAFLEAAASGVRVRDVLSGRLAAPEWVTLQARPSDADLTCTERSTLFWSTSLKDGVPHATRIGVRDHVDALPFEVTPDRDRRGNRRVAAVADGWIVGFDDGEFGGGLWWFNRDGSRSRRIRPAPGASADLRVPENVVGLPKVGERQLVLMGLDHITPGPGGVFRLERASSGWVLVRLRQLDGEPDPWVVADNRLLFLTASGLWSFEPKGSVTRLHRTDIGTFSPSAIVRAPDGAIYVGLRHYVVKLEPSSGQWRETWMAPAACTTVEMRDGRCECAG